MNHQGREPSVVAKHKLLVVEDGKRQLHLCDVTSWDDSKQVEHGISGKLEVTSRRSTPSKSINWLPKFRLTLSARADVALVTTNLLARLRRDKQAAVVVLNKHGWVGYLLPHDRDPKLYCHFHHQAHMDAFRQQVSSQKPAKMSRLSRIHRGPWTSRKVEMTEQEGLDGPDYDPGEIYTMDELDPYIGMPSPPDKESLLPTPYSTNGGNEVSAFIGGFRNKRVDNSSNLGNIGRGQVVLGKREGGPLSAQAEAAAKYGEELRKEAQQASSFIYHLKRFNNWVKSTLISKAEKDPANPGLRVLDLACGKGGDLGKWASHPDGIERYVGSDIAFGSLEHLVERMAKSGDKGRFNWREIPVKLFEADLGRNNVQRDRTRVWENTGVHPGEWDDQIPLNEGDLFDVASMQFALHYMGQTEERMRRFLHEVSRHLRVGGIFIATTMDSRVLMQLLMGHAEQSWDSSLERTTLKVEIEDERKHNLVSIMFKDPLESYLRQHYQDSDGRGPYGLEYTFTLRETELNKNAVDEVPEWMLPLDAFKDAAADFGLDLVTAQNFHDFYAEESQRDPARRNLRSMHVFNPEGTMNRAEWRIAGVYMALVLRKTSAGMQSVGAAAPSSPPFPPPRQHLPASPKAPPPFWEGPPPIFEPASPDHPPPESPISMMGGGNIGDSAPRSPQPPPTMMGGTGFAPQSPTFPPPDVDSDEDDIYDKALAVARSAVPPQEWEGYSPEKKKACIDMQMRVLTEVNGLSP